MIFCLSIKPSDNVYGTIWIGLTYKQATNRYVWSDGRELVSTDPIRIGYSYGKGNGTSGEDCYAAYLYSYFSRWAYRWIDCNSTAASLACQGFDSLEAHSLKKREAVSFLWITCLTVSEMTCPDPPNIPNARSDFLVGLCTPPSPGTTVNYTCLWLTQGHQITCQSNGTWTPDPSTLVCPEFSNSTKSNHQLSLPILSCCSSTNVMIVGATMQCYKNRALANESAVFDIKARPVTVKECSAMCKMDKGCQGIYLKPATVIGSQPFGRTQQGAGSCSLFLLNATLTMADMIEVSGAKVCRHIYRDTTIWCSCRRVCSCHWAKMPISAIQQHTYCRLWSSFVVSSDLLRSRRIKFWCGWTPTIIFFCFIEETCSVFL